jgi:O-antigen/teichoic acid export membrane protein
MIQKLKPKSEFTRNVLTLMTGTTIAQAIPIAISPILTRIYTPQDYGIVALYMSIATIASIIATGRYEMAIMLPKKDTDAINILLLSIGITFLMSFISFLIIFLFNQEITNFLGNQDVSIWLYLVPVSVLLTGIYQGLRYWNNRKKYFKNLAKNTIIQAGTNSSLNLSFGFLGFGAGGLIFSGLIGKLISILFLSKIAWNKDSQLLKSKNNLKIIALLKLHKKLPLFNLPNALIDTFRTSGINILIAKLFTISSLGHYSLAWRMVVTPASLIGNSLSQVLFQKLSSSKKNRFIFSCYKIYF